MDLVYSLEPILFGYFWEQLVSEKILIGVAWPYANGLQHIGHIAGAYLPSDIFARFQRMRGREVLMVSGSDTHGTPVTVTAEAEGVSPGAVVAKYHAKFIECYQKIGLTFDLFTHTDTETHWEVAREFFLDHHNKGILYRETQKQLYDGKAQKFLPDRYVEGTCPHCNAPDARGDQCDNCGKTYEAIELKNPRSKMTGSTDLEVRETEHFFFDLAKVNEPLKKWIDSEHPHWRPAAINLARSTIGSGELRGRPITRDLDWGISVPLPGYDGKCLYVWYEAVMGYVSAVKEWAKLSGKPEAWRDFWSDARQDVRSYYFLGKDNTYFHAVLWPAMLLAKGGLHLPYDVVANEYLNTYGRKLSKSRGNVISIAEGLENYQADAWRFALTAMAPESVDSDFTWDDFYQRVNSELVANWGNLANRVLGFAFKRYDGKVPVPGEFDASDKALLADIQSGFASVSALYESAKPKICLSELLRLSQRVNQYLSEKIPWTVAKTDPAKAGTAIYAALQCITWLKTMWAPLLPFSCQQLHEMLGFDGQLFGQLSTQEVKDSRGSHLVMRYEHGDAIGRWEEQRLEPGQALREPKALFIKLDEKLMPQV